MEIFFNILKKTLVATTAVIFAFAILYTPQQYNSVHRAEAQEPVIDAANIVQTTLIAGYTYLTSVSLGELAIKEYFLDGIAWAVVKAALDTMLSSMVDWINSGFNGRPTFIQDIAEYLREVADGVVGEYIEQLGGLGSYLCDPFKLDIQIALQLEYDLDRINQPSPTCTLTDVIDNIEGFLAGDSGSFFEGGWDDWIDITMQPEVYTPYGAYLTAQEGLYRNVLEAEQKESKLVDYGSGFLSMKDCEEAPTGPDTTKTVCTVSTPGKIIQESLSFNLDSGRQSLVAADEIDEAISGLLYGLVQSVFSEGGSLLDS